VRSCAVAGSTTALDLGVQASQIGIVRCATSREPGGHRSGTGRDRQARQWTHDINLWASRRKGVLITVFDSAATVPGSGDWDCSGGRLIRRTQANAHITARRSSGLWSGRRSVAGRPGNPFEGARPCPLGAGMEGGPCFEWDDPRVTNHRISRGAGLGRVYARRQGGAASFIRARGLFVSGGRLIWRRFYVGDCSRCIEAVPLGVAGKARGGRHRPRTSRAAQLYRSLTGCASAMRSVLAYCAGPGVELVNVAMRGEESSAVAHRAKGGLVKLTPRQVAAAGHHRWVSVEG